MQLNSKTGKAAMSYPINSGKTLNVAAFTFGRKEWPHEKWIVPAEHEELSTAFKGWGKAAQGLIKVSHRCPYGTSILGLRFHPSFLTNHPSPPGPSSTVLPPPSSTMAM